MSRMFYLSRIGEISFTLRTEELRERLDFKPKISEILIKSIQKKNSLILDKQIIPSYFFNHHLLFLEHYGITNRQQKKGFRPLMEVVRSTFARPPALA